MRKGLPTGVVVLVLALGLIASGCGGSDESASGDLLASIKDKGVLTVSTDPAYPPASKLNKDTGEFEGFDIDVATEIAKRLGVDVAWKTPGWDTITAGNWSGRWDVSVGSMTITPERSEVLYFTKPYYFTPASVAVNADNTTITEASQLSGKKIGVGVATTYDSYLEGKLTLQDETGKTEDVPSVITDPSVRTYETDALALDDLALGDGTRLDGAVTATPIVQGAIDAKSKVKIIGQPLYYEPLAVAADRSSELDPQSLVEEISKIITEMHEDGTLSKLSKQWYGIDYSISS